MSNNRQTPIAHALTGSRNGIDATLAHLTDLVSRGVKGPALQAWATQFGIDLPPNLYDVINIGKSGSLARVGNQEITLDCAEDDPFLARFDQSLSHPTPGIYRIEQQPALFDLHGDHALRVLAQTCGVDPAIQPPNRILFTRIAGVSCGMIVREEAGGRGYRIRVDYTLAPYLWEALVGIVGEL
jgi:hypothetical protein